MGRRGQSSSTRPITSVTTPTTMRSRAIVDVGISGMANCSARTTRTTMRCRHVLTPCSRRGNVFDNLPWQVMGVTSEC